MPLILALADKHAKRFTTTIRQAVKRSEPLGTRAVHMNCLSQCRSCSRAAVLCFTAAPSDTRAHKHKHTRTTSKPITAVETRTQPLQ